MSRNYVWLIRYALMIVVALILGAAIGELSLFKQATLGTHKLTAAKLAQFLGYGGALFMFWLLAQRAMHELNKQGGWARIASFVVLPFATLVVVIAAYYIVLIVGGGLMSRTFRAAYNWVFVLGITAAAIWLAVALFRHSESLVELLRLGQGKRKQP